MLSFDVQKSRFSVLVAVLMICGQGLAQTLTSSPSTLPTAFPISQPSAPSVSTASGTSSTTTPTGLDLPSSTAPSVSPASGTSSTTTPTGLDLPSSTETTPRALTNEPTPSPNSMPTPAPYPGPTPSPNPEPTPSSQPTPGPTAAPVELVNCTDCLIGSGPCFQSLSNGSKFCIISNEQTGQCYIGSEACTVDSSSTTQTTTETHEDCTDCLTGSGPCFQRLANGSKFCMSASQITQTCFIGSESCATESSSTIQATTATQIEDCDNCFRGSGPCFQAFGNGSKICLPVSPFTGQCFVGSQLCGDITQSPSTVTSNAPSNGPTALPSMHPTLFPSYYPSPAPSTIPSQQPTIPTDYCTNCLSGTSGPCMHLPSKYCLPTLQPSICIQTTTLCSTFQTTAPSCLQCSFLDGPCIHESSGVCFPADPDSKLCPEFAVARNCPDVTDQPPTVQPTTEYNDDPSFYDYGIVHTSGGSTNPGYRFSTVFNASARLYSLADRPNEICIQLCTRDQNCAGIYIENISATERFCVGLNDLGIGVVTSADSVSLRKAPLTTTQTTSTTVSTTSMTRTSSTHTTATTTTLTSTTLTSTTKTSTTSTSTTNLPARYTFSLIHSSLSDGSTGSRFATAFNRESHIFSINNTDPVTLQNICEQQCAEDFSCAGYFIWSVTERSRGSNSGYKCHGLSTIVGEPKLIDTYSQSVSRQRLCERCSFNFQGPCRHGPSGFCMETIPYTNDCVAQFSRCDDFPPPESRPTSAPTAAPQRL